jgi:hypothetical protein
MIEILVPRAGAGCLMDPIMVRFCSTCGECFVCELCSPTGSISVDEDFASQSSSPATTRGGGTASAGMK